MAGCRGGRPRLGTPSPRLWCMVLGSSLRISSVSGGKSTMRNTDPFLGGLMPMSMAARSLVPERSAGVWSVTHSTRDTVCACGRTFLCGVGPSISTTALSFLSTVVTTRRMSALKAMVAFLPFFGCVAGTCRIGHHATTQGRRPAGPLERLRVHQHEGERRRLVGAVAPGVIGAALDQHIASLEQHLAFVHQRVDLAGQHDGVVHRACLVEAGMAGRAAVERVGVAGAIVGRGPLLFERGKALLVGRILDDAEHRAALRRHQPERMIGDLGIAAVVGRRRSRLPQLGDLGAAPAAAIDVRRRAIHHEHGAAGSVVAGHHPANRFGHALGSDGYGWMLPSGMWAPLRLAPSRLAPVRMARDSRASERLAPERLAPLRSAPNKSASDRLAPLRLASRSAASTSPALLRLAPSRSARRSVTSTRLAALRSAPRSEASSRRAPVTIASDRVAPSSLARVSRAFCSLASVRSAPLRSAALRSAS